MLSLASGITRLGPKLISKPAGFATSQITGSRYSICTTKSLTDYGKSSSIIIANRPIPTLFFKPKNLQFRTFTNWQQNTNYNYNRFSSFGAKMWYYRTFIIGGAVVVIVYVYWNLDTVEISGRVRMVDISRSSEIRYCLYQMM